MSQIYHESTLYDLIKKEDNLIRQKELIDFKLVNALYEEEAAMDHGMMHEMAKDKVKSLRSEKEAVNQQIEEVRTDIKRKLLRLFE